MNDDQKLGQLLRQVECPDDLRDRLLAIPTLNVRPRRNRQTAYRIAAITAAVAASLAIAGFLSAHWQSSKPETAERSDDATRHSVAVAENIADNSEAERLPAPLNAFREKSVEAKQLLEELEMRQLKMRTIALKVQRTKREIQIDQASLAMALATRSGWQWGASPQYADEQYAQVIQRFPNSQGAELASRWLTRQ